MEIEDLLHKTIQVERQLKSKNSSNFASPSSSSWRSNWKNNKVVINPKMCQGVGHITSQCPNKKAMIMMNNGEIESESSSDDEMPPLEDCSDVEVAKPIDRVVLVTRRALSIQHKEDGDVECHINDKWLNDYGDIRVTKQVFVSFSISKYKDKVLFYVVPMHDGHLLLGFPCKFDRKITHDGYKNRYTLAMNKHIIVLTPFKSIEAYANQIRIAKKCKLREEQLSIQEKREKKR
ncbi:hypothetical protein CR513_03619, partial [Mucuna pruriens]